MSVKDKMMAGTVLLVAAVLAGTLGMLAHRDRIVSAFNYITDVTERDADDSNEKGDADNTLKDSLKIAITFDDGPHPYYTEQLLDGLQERNVPATFFVTGKQAEAYPELVKRMQDEGHLIGNHTYSHIQLGKGNRKSYIEELVKTNEVIKEITGEETQYVRPPYGSWDKSIEAELTMFPVLWTIDPLDWCSDNVSCIVQKVIAKAGENDIILMHDQYKTTVTAAFEIIDELKAQGYEFVTVDEILFD